MDAGLSRHSEAVATRIGEGIRSGSWRVGQFLPPLREIAREQGAGYKTVWRAVKALEAEGLLASEPRKGYRVVSSVPKFCPELKGALVFVHAKSSEESEEGSEHALMWAGAREEALGRGMTVLVKPFAGPAINAIEAQELLGAAAGVICDRVDIDSVMALVEAGLPVVRIHNYSAGLPVDAVVQDDMGGITRALKYLADCGHRRIGYLDTSEWLRPSGESYNTEVRLAGFQAGRGNLGLDLDPELVLSVNLQSHGALADLLAAGATAVVSPHMDIWEVASDGVKLPDEFGRVAWCGLPGGLPEDDPEVPSHILWSREEMGREAARRLMARIENPEMSPVTALISTQLVDRGTGGRG